MISFFKNKIISSIILVSIITTIVISWQKTQPEQGAEESQHVISPYTVIVHVDAYPPKVLQPIHFTIDLNNANQLPVSGADIQVRLSMPKMMCGTTEFQATETKPGHYEGEGTSLMPGLQSADIQILAEHTSIQVNHDFVATR